MSIVGYHRHRHLQPERRHQHRDRQPLPGLLDGSSGTYNLSGTGLLQAGNESVGDGPGLGTFNQDGGTNTVAGTLYVGHLSSGTGTYNLSRRHPLSRQ